MKAHYLTSNLLILLLSIQVSAQDVPVANGASSPPPPPPSLNSKYQRVNPIAPRYQWEANGGYCGEVSFIQSGLYYGQYLSQYGVRDIASNHHQGSDYQLLLGVNDLKTATALRLQAQPMQSAYTNQFLRWVKKHVVNGHPVIIGVMNNEYLFYNDTLPTAGQPDYDHIVCVTGWGSDQPLDQDSVYGTDILLIEDHGVYNQDATFKAIPDQTVQYWFPIPVDTLLGNRQLANSQTNTNRIYTLLNLNPATAPDSIFNYGIAILGPQDTRNETVPVRLATNINYQAPEIDKSTEMKPLAHPIMISLTAYNLVPGQKYNLHLYLDYDKVPTSNFNADHKSIIQTFTAQTNNWTFSIRAEDDKSYFFRLVPTN